MNHLQTNREDQLDEVLAVYLRAVAAGSTPDRQALLATHPDLADDLAAFFADSDRVARVAAPLRAAAAGQSGTPTHLGDYEVLEELGRGGMGVVFRARQRSLGRLVALKLLTDGPLADEVDRQRFRAEAETCAALDHPHLVPIYEVGSQDGFAYFSMKLVTGGTLANRLPDYYGDPRGAARLLVAIADAVHHAHQHGVLHRDLKPANVLLEDGFGGPIPYVSDFGLARCTPMEKGPAMRSPGPTTRTGSVLGTPAYMAPEQAEGARGGVTVAADVYGLGATLYALLTGRPPFEGSTPFDTLRQVREQEPTPPRRFNPAVPRDLETICLKCLHKDPARRYASAADLAADLRRFLNGEPVLARPISEVERAWFWVCRQPVLAGLALALGLAIVTGLGLVSWQWRRAEASLAEAQHQRAAAESQSQEAEYQRRQVLREWQRAEANLAEADRQRQQAEANFAEADASFRQARSVVQAYCRSLARELEQAPGLQPLARSLLEQALVHHRAFLARRGQDPILRRDLADTHVSLARITNAIGKRAVAAETAREALEIYRALHREAPEDRVVRYRLVETLGNLGIYLDNTDQALATFTEALALYDAFLMDDPSDFDLRSGRANTLNNLGAVHVRTGHLSAAREYCTLAMVAQKELCLQPKAPPSLRSDLANTLGNLATLTGREVGGLEESLALYEEARRLRQGLLAESPRNARRQADLASSHQSIGIVLRDLGRPDQALEAFRQAHVLREHLADSFPTVTRYGVELASSLTNLGILASQAKDKEAALSYYEQARDLLDRLCRKDPNNFTLLKDLGLAHFNAGVIHGALNRRPQEEKAFREARRLQEDLVKRDPENLEVRCDLGRTLNNLGQNLLATKRSAEAVPILHEAIEHQGLAHRRAPLVVSYRQNLRAHLGTLAEAEYRLGHVSAFLTAALARRDLYPDNPNELYCYARDLARAVQLLRRTPAKDWTLVDLVLQAGLEAQSLETLRLAIDAGFVDATRLNQEHGFDVLRDREEFKACMRRLADKR